MKAAKRSVEMPATETADTDISTSADSRMKARWAAIPLAQSRGATASAIEKVLTESPWTHSRLGGQDPEWWADQMVRVTTMEAEAASRSEVEDRGTSPASETRVAAKAPIEASNRAAEAPFEEEIVRWVGEALDAADAVMKFAKDSISFVVLGQHEMIQNGSHGSEYLNRACDALWEAHEHGRIIDGYIGPLKARAEKLLQERSAGVKTGSLNAASAAPRTGQSSERPGWEEGVRAAADTAVKSVEDAIVAFVLAVEDECGDTEQEDRTKIALISARNHAALISEFLDARHSVQSGEAS